MKITHVLFATVAGLSVAGGIFWMQHRTAEEGQGPNPKAPQATSQHSETSQEANHSGDADPARATKVDRDSEAKPSEEATSPELSKLQREFAEADKKGKKKILLKLADGPDPTESFKTIAALLSQEPPRSSDPLASFPLAGAIGQTGWHLCDSIIRDGDMTLFNDIANTIGRHESLHVQQCALHVIITAANQNAIDNGSALAYDAYHAQEDQRFRDDILRNFGSFRDNPELLSQIASEEILFSGKRNWYIHESAEKFSHMIHPNYPGIEEGLGAQSTVMNMLKRRGDDDPTALRVKDRVLKEVRDIGKDAKLTTDELEHVLRFMAKWDPEGLQELRMVAYADREAATHLIDKAIRTTEQK